MPEAGLPDIATVPLNALIALHLLARDILAMTQGVSIQTRDTGEEYTASWELPPDFRSHLEELKESPQALAVICRLVARSVYLANDLPLAILDLERTGQHKEAPPLSILVQEVDIVDELEAIFEDSKGEKDQLLHQPVPVNLKYWNDWKEGHVMAALKEYRSLWHEIRGVYLAAPVKVASRVDPAVASGMAKAAWAAPTFKPQPVRRKRMSAVEDEGLDSEDEWEIIGLGALPEAWGETTRSPAQAVAQAPKPLPELEGREAS